MSEIKGVRRNNGADTIEDNLKSEVRKVIKEELEEIKNRQKNIELLQKDMVKMMVEYQQQNTQK